MQCPKTFPRIYGTVRSLLFIWNFTSRLAIIFRSEFSNQVPFLSTISFVNHAIDTFSNKKLISNILLKFCSKQQYQISKQITKTSYSCRLSQVHEFTQLNPVASSSNNVGKLIGHPLRVRTLHQQRMRTSRYP